MKQKDVSHIEKNSKTTGINPTPSVIMLREKKPVIKVHITYLYLMSRLGKSMEEESRLRLPRVGGGREMKSHC